MKTIHSIQELRNELSNKTGQCIGFVPTMGNLHQGHLSLIRLAHQHADFITVSIFVNPLQFECNGDFNKYPRTLREDTEKLEGENVDLLFAPFENEMYREPQEFRIHPPTNLSDILEGETRPGFFIGVCTVVMKLFSIVQPNVAILGKKDYQQAVILQKMCHQLNMAVNIILGDTVRDEDGLALSSRNRFLSNEFRKEAAFLYQTMQTVAKTVKNNPDENLEILQSNAVQTLVDQGWKPFYVQIRDKRTLKKPDKSNRGNMDLIVLAAAEISGVRLIDNLEV